MKIALFVHCFLPNHFYGTETYTLNLATNLRQMGHDAVVVTANFPWETKKEEEVYYYEYKGVPVYCINKNHFPYTSIKDLYYQPQIRDLLRQLLLEIKPDLVHVTHIINHTGVLLEVTQELHIPAVATLTDFFGICYNAQLRSASGALCRGPNRFRTNCIACRLKEEATYSGASRMERWMGKYPLSLVSAVWKKGMFNLFRCRTGKSADLVSSISDMPDVLRQCYSAYKTVIAPTCFLRDAYLTNGLNVPVHLSHFGVDSSRLPKQSNGGRSLIRFAYIGQIAPYKGIDVLIQAFSRLPEDSAEVLIFGKESQIPDYTEKLKRMSKGHRISFRGTFPPSEIDAVLAEIDFLVIPSKWYENSPLVLLNALANHTPVIVSNVPGMTEFVEEGKNGYIFKRGNVTDLERTLRRIIREPEKARALSLTTSYPRTTRMMVEDVVEIYENILSGKTIKK